MKVNADVLLHLFVSFDNVVLESKQSAAVEPLWLVFFFFLCIPFWKKIIEFIILKIYVHISLHSNLIRFFHK